MADALAAVAPPDVARLDDDEHRRWLTHATRLLQRASWEGARGAPVGDPARHTIAAHAALLISGIFVMAKSAATSSTTPAMIR